MKHVAITINSLRRGGGAEKIAAAVGNGLSSRGFDVTFITFSATENNYHTDCEVICLNDAGDINSSWQAGKAIFSRGRKVARIANRHDVDTLISFMYEANFAALGSKLFGFGGEVLVSSRVHPQEGGKNARRIAKIAYPYADAVVCCAKGLERCWRQDYGLENTITIHNFIDQDRVQREAKKLVPEQYQNIFKSSPVFVHIGRLEKQKGQWHLLRAFKSVKKSIPDAHLVMLGEGSLRARLNTLSQNLGIADSIHLLGNQKNVFPFLAQADCFVSASLWEGMPNTLLEALSVGVPAVFTDCLFGPREIIAPEENLGNDLEYPYKNECAMLVSDLAHPRVNTIFDDRPLLEKEQVLAKAMINSVTNTGASQNCNMERFTKQTVIDKWHNLLQS